MAKDCFVKQQCKWQDYFHALRNFTASRIQFLVMSKWTWSYFCHISRHVTDKNSILVAEQRTAPSYPISDSGMAWGWQSERHWEHPSGHRGSDQSSAEKRKWSYCCSLQASLKQQLTIVTISIHTINCCGFLYAVTQWVVAVCTVLWAMPWSSARWRKWWTSFRLSRQSERKNRELLHQQ